MTFTHFVDTYDDKRNEWRKEKDCGFENVAIVVEGLPETIRFPFELLLDGFEKDPLILCHPFYRRITGNKANRLTLNQRSLWTNLHDLRILVIKAPVSGYTSIEEKNEQQTITTEFSFGELKHVEEEVDAIKKIFPNAHVIPSRKEAATREDLKTCLEEHWDIIHFAGHGLYVDEDLSGIVLSTSGKGDDPDILGPDDMSGLFEKCPIDLVYLSSCEGAMTGTTPSQTFYSNFDGVIRGLLSGGVPRIIANRWPISDKAACIMATAFYYELIKNRLSLESALLEARKEVYRVDRKENAWASAVLIVSADVE